MNEFEQAVITEYRELMKKEKLIRDALSELPFGYLQKKTISNKEYHYLQYREGKKVKSLYVKNSELEETREALKKRKEYELAFKNLKNRKEILEQIIEKDLLQILAIKQAVLVVVSEYKVIKKVVLFGSRAEGRYRDDSDVDLLFESKGSVSLMKQNEIRMRLEEEIGLSVDLVHGPLEEDAFIEIEKEVEMYAA